MCFLLVFWARREGTLAAALLKQMNIFKCRLLSCILGKQVIKKMCGTKMRKNAVDLTRLHKHERFGTHSQSSHEGLTYPTWLMITT